MSCTCPDFISKQKKYVYGIDTHCKHIRAKCIDLGAFKKDTLKRAVYQNSFPADFFIPVSKRLVFGFQKDNSWIDVYALSKNNREARIGIIDRYGYCLLEKRWSYGENPYGSREIRKVLNMIIEAGILS